MNLLIANWIFRGLLLLMCLSFNMPRPKSILITFYLKKSCAIIFHVKVEWRKMQKLLGFLLWTTYFHSTCIFTACRVHCKHKLWISNISFVKNIKMRMLQNGIFAYSHRLSPSLSFFMEAIAKKPRQSKQILQSVFLFIWK